MHACSDNILMRDKHSSRNNSVSSLGEFINNPYTWYTFHGLCNCYHVTWMQLVISHQEKGRFKSIHPNDSSLAVQNFWQVGYSCTAR